MGQSVAKMLSDLDRRKRILDAHRPLPPATVNSLYQALRIEHTYTSNAIEGNSLTLQETTVVLEGLTVGGKPLRDHLEAIDHAEAFDYIQRLTDRKERLTETVLRSIHALVLRRSQPAEAGRYRHVRVFIGGSHHIPPEPIAVPGLMRDLLEWLQSAEKVTHPVVLSAEFHARLVTIHPFADGNGRTARLASNLLLTRNGYPPATWRTEDRPRYYSALEVAHDGSTYADIITLTAVAIARTFDLYEQAYERGDDPGALTGLSQE